MTKENFFRKIDALNNIIGDDEILTFEHEKWMTEGRLAFQKVFEPYSGRLFSILYNHHLLPSFMTRSRKNQILDYINCESHLDKLRFIMKNTSI